MSLVEVIAVVVPPVAAGVTVSKTLALPGQPCGSVAVTLKLKVPPDPIGVPESTPVMEFIVNPGGTLPVTVHVRPVGENCCVYRVPTVAEGNAPAGEIEIT